MTPTTRYTLVFMLLGCILFMPFLGGVHLFDWDEINFAEAAREMIVLKEYLRVHINFQPFWEKPPLFMWLQSAAMHLFGIGEYAARFPNAVCGVLTLVVLFRMGAKLHDWKFGALWAGAYMGSVLPHLYFKSGIIDPWFNLFIFIGLYLFIQFYWKKDGYTSVWLNYNKYVYLVGGGLVLGLGVLTKGPVAYLIVALTLFVYWVLQRFRFYVNVPQFLLFTLATALVTLAWFGLETLLNGPWFINTFITYNYRLFKQPDAGHGGFPGYHFVVLLVGCFPASIFCLRGFGRIPQQFMYQRDFKLWMTILFWVVLVLFTIVRSKIVHYSSMCYFPLTYLAALTAYEIIEGRVKFAPWMRGLLIGIGGLFCVATIVLPFVAMRIAVLKPLFRKDPFAAANLDAVVNWTGFEAFAGLWLFGVIGMSLRYIQFNRAERGFATLFLGTAVFVNLTLIFFIGRIELYSQGAAIRFFEGLQPKVQNGQCYVVNFGYRSYAQMFYTRRQPLPKQGYDEQWLLRGDVDRDVYIITKINKTAELAGVPGLQKLGEENGFVFYKRSAVARPRQP